MSNPEMKNPIESEGISSAILNDLRAENEALRARISDLELTIGQMASDIAEIKSALMPVESKEADTEAVELFDQDEEDAQEEPKTSDERLQALLSVDIDENESTGKFKGARKQEGFIKRNWKKIGAAAVGAVAFLSIVDAPPLFDNDDKEKTVNIINDSEAPADNTDSSTSETSSSTETEDSKLLSASDMENIIEGLGVAGNVSRYTDGWNTNIVGLSPIEAGSYSMNTGKTLEAAADGEMSINDTIKLSQNTLNGEYGADRAADAREAMLNAGFTEAQIDSFMESEHGSMDGYQTFAIQAEQAGIFAETPYVNANGEVVYGSRAFTAGDIFLVHVADADGKVIVTRIDCGSFIQDGKLIFETPPTPEVPETPPTTAPPTTTPPTTTPPTTTPPTTTTTTLGDKTPVPLPTVTEFPDQEPGDPGIDPDTPDTDNEGQDEDGYLPGENPNTTTTVPAEEEPDAPINEPENPADGTVTVPAAIGAIGLGSMELARRRKIIASAPEGLEPIEIDLDNEA